MELIISFLLVAVWPMVGLLFGWWGSFALLPERYIPLCAVVGCVGGALFGFGKWVDIRRSLFFLQWTTLLGTLAFYALGMFGFFMGVPVFHIGLAIPAGWYWGARMKSRKYPPSEIKKQRWLVEWCVGGIVILVSIISGLIAWYDPYTLANLRGMLQLQLTPLFLLLTIIIGGCFLVVGTMVLTRLMFWWGYRTGGEHGGDQ